MFPSLLCPQRPGSVLAAVALSEMSHETGKGPVTGGWGSQDQEEESHCVLAPRALLPAH